MYAADELLTQQGMRVNIFEKLPTPYGLVRAGVAPDHQSTKRVTRLFDEVTRLPGFTFFLNVEVGSDLSHAELLAHHHAVLYAVGAPNDRRLDIDGMRLPGTGTATEIVAWINGHPEYTGLPVDLGHERVVVVGNGNVALDVARILTTHPDALACTDISDHALAALRQSNVTEVVIAARRGPAQSAFTLPELIGLTSTCEVVLDAADRRLVLADLAAETESADPQQAGDPEQARRRVGARDASADPARVPPHAPPRPRIRPGHRRGVHVTDSDETRRLDAGLVLTSIGYRGKPIRDLPFDESAAVVPNDGGRVVDPQTGEPVRGSYVAGWIKRGPTGFIGTNKSCALQTVQHLVDDYNAGSSHRSGGQARRAATSWCAAGDRRWSTRPAGTRSTRPRSRAAARTARATSSPRSPTCWPSPPPRPRPHCGSECSPGCGADTPRRETEFQQRKFE